MNRSPPHHWSRRLWSLFGSRVSRLPPSSQRLLLIAALEGSGDLGVLQAAFRAVGGRDDLEDLSPAERDHLVDIGIDTGTRRLSFRHPLIRSATIAISTSSDLRSAHRALAQVLVRQPDRRAWHLGEASLEPDEQVAAMLEKAARGFLERGDAAGTVAALTRAADLSPLGPARGRRLAEAAFVGADVTGDLHNAAELLEGARRADPDGPGSLHAAAAAVHLLINGDGDIDTAHRLLVGAIEAGTHTYQATDHALIDALHTLMLLCWSGNRRDLWTPFYAALDRLRPAAPAALGTAGKTFPDPARTAAPALRQLDDLVDSLRGETDPALVLRTGTAAFYLGRPAGMREPSLRVVRQGRDGGPVRRHIGALMNLCTDDYQTGRWDELGELADEGLGLCDAFGYPFFAWYFHYNRAMLAAARGDTGTSEALAERIIRWGVPRGVLATVPFAGQVRALAAIGAGDFESAYGHATAISPAGVLASHVPQALWVTMDLVEAAVRTERYAEAAAHVRAVREARIAALSPRLALLAGGSAALSAVEDQEALALFEETLALPDIDRWPFDLARVRLAHGERLRRARATTESRIPLGAAMEGFEALGAQPWKDRAAKELRATGLSMPDSPRTVRVLTPQEQEIALLAASGLTNKQIAERLFLSHRTVGAHLYQIFPKLGITSRSALRDALASLQRSTSP